MKALFGNILIIVNIILYMVGVFLWISITDEIYLNLIVSICAIVNTLILLIFYRKKFKDYYTSSQFKYLCDALISCFLICCIIGLVNYLAFKNPIEFDVTQRKVHSLSPQTLKVLESVDDEISIDIYAKRENFQPISTLMELYRLKNSAFKFNYIDAELNPDLIAKNRITQIPTLIIKKGEKVAKAQRVRELELTSAILKVIRERETTLCVDSSHTKFSWYNDGRDHFSALRKLLELELFKIEDIKLVAGESLKSCDTLVLWGTEIDLNKDEIANIEAFREGGGSLLVGINPQFNGDTISLFRDYLAEEGINVHNILSISPDSTIDGSNGAAPIAKTFAKSHPIFQNYSGFVFFPLATAISFKGNLGLKAVELIKSTNMSWGESDFINLDKKKFDKGKDLAGPLNFAVSREFENGSRIVIYSNTSFVSNAYTKFTSNFNVLVNTLNWLTKNDQLITFDRIALKDEPLFISSPQLGVIFFFSVLVLPITLIIISILLYRRKGKL
ncbi:Gldg family protein [Halobacteriovorax marinus]|uniref:Gldg family protein n=1 Tax=Halobacteriovorax marinus TaxID=97084 RepID=UPI003A921D49